MTSGLIFDKQRANRARKRSYEPPSKSSNIMLVPIQHQECDWLSMLYHLSTVKTCSENYPKDIVPL